MAIVGMMVAISAPSISAGLDSIRMASATQSVASFLNAGVTHAERSQQPVELVIAPKDSRLTAYSNEPGFERELKLPDGVSIEAILPETPDEANEPVRRLMLMPGGTVPGIGIQLANGHGTRRIVRLDPMTGFPRVENVTKQ